MIAKARGGVRSPSAGVKQVLSNRKVEGKPVLNPDGAPETYGQIEYNFPDGTRVRIKPNGDMMSSTDPMYSVELTHPDAPRRGMPQESIAFKYDAGGHPVPKGPQDIRNPYPDGTAAHKAYQDALIQAGHLHGGTDANPSIAKPTQSPSSTQPLGN